MVKVQIEGEPFGYDSPTAAIIILGYPSKLAAFGPHFSFHLSVLWLQRYPPLLCQTGGLTQKGSISRLSCPSRSCNPEAPSALQAPNLWSR